MRDRVNTLWIHYDFLCDLDTQIGLHKTSRSKIPEWFETGLARRSVLTYHFAYPHRRKNDSLYLCLDIPSVISPPSRSVHVSEETVEQIPLKIQDTVNKMASNYLVSPQDRLRVIDFEWELISGNASRQYNNAPIEEILRFASKGTDIALKTLDDQKTRNEMWRTDGEIVDFVNKSVQENLVSERERRWGLHFACNSTFLGQAIELIIRAILNQQIDGEGRGILEFLYKIEKTGNFGEALQCFLQEYRRFFQRA